MPARVEERTHRRVVVADDHPPTRAAVRRVLEAAGMHVCGDTGDADEAIRLAIRESPDVALLDIRMPGNGIRAAAAIAAQVPRTAIVMLTVSRDDDDLFDSLRAGACGYLLKGTDPANLADELEKVLTGEAVLSPHLVAILIEEFRRRSGHRRLVALRRSQTRLTEREWEVLDCLRQELSTAQIAGRLYLSTATVRSHIASVVRKLHVANRDEAAALFREDRDARWTDI